MLSAPATAIVEVQGDTVIGAEENDPAPRLKGVRRDDQCKEQGVIASKAIGKQRPGFGFAVGGDVGRELARGKTRLRPRKPPKLGLQFLWSAG